MNSMMIFLIEIELETFCNRRARCARKILEKISNFRRKLSITKFEFDWSWNCLCCQQLKIESLCEDIYSCKAHRVSSAERSTDTFHQSSAARSTRINHTNSKFSFYIQEFSSLCFRLLQLHRHE